MTVEEMYDFMKKMRFDITECDVCGKNAVDLCMKYGVIPEDFFKAIGDMVLCLNCHAGAEGAPDGFTSPDEKVQKAIRLYRRKRGTE